MEKELKTMIKIKYFIKVEHNKTILQNQTILKAIQEIHRWIISNEKIKNKKITASGGYIDNANGYFGLLIENINDVEFIEYINLFVLGMKNMLYQIPEEPNFLITNISSIRITNDMWQNFTYLLKHMESEKSNDN